MDSPTILWHGVNSERVEIETFRNNHLQDPSYAPSPLFLSRTSWLASVTHDTLCNSKDGLPALVSVIGSISSEGLFMEPQGNYDGNATHSQPNNCTSNFEQAEYQFSLIPPVGHADLRADFTAAVSHFRTVAGFVADPPGSFEEWNNERSFIGDDGHSHITLNFSFPLFNRTGSHGSAEHEWAHYRASLDAEYKHLLDPIIDSFTLQHLSVSDYFGQCEVKEEEYQNRLDGALVEVLFNLSNMYGQGLYAVPVAVAIIHKEDKK
ncbi:hypothetical protein BDN70DRAFT_940158 [Pholiota conissans]|uniref:Uncharacterized protein n=1 Tax=Pholiota conissans TaxID=109636 RepID=A0A9P5YJF5_9AGAR|nr:hypothetical protein BDN70DRAFT_940158 [Pholiota conissans]